MRSLYVQVIESFQNKKKTYAYQEQNCKKGKNKKKYEAKIHAKKLNNVHNEHQLNLRMECPGRVDRE